METQESIKSASLKIRGPFHYKETQMQGKTQKAKTSRSKITGSDIRRARIVASAATGQTNKAIANSVGLSEIQVCRVLALADSQEHLATVIEGLNDQINTRLPQLLTNALDKLQNALDEPYVSFSDRMKCISLVLQTATRLSELSIKSNSKNQ